MGMFHQNISIRILETPHEMVEVVDLQRLVWPGDETELVPVNILIAAMHGGGLILGAYHDGSSIRGPFFDPLEDPKTSPNQSLVGFAFGFPGIYQTPDGPRLKHCSHMLGVHPEFRNRQIGFQLKRAQWQMVRQQGIDRITWTYDPLGSRNAYLNITKLGAVCNTYYVNCYGIMQDELNRGLPSDRFEVDWWVNSHRTKRRLGKQARRPLCLDDFERAQALIIQGMEFYPDKHDQLDQPMVLLEIPADFQGLRAKDSELAQQWRHYTRQAFQSLFKQGYLVTDFIYETVRSKSFYVLTHGDATL